MTPVGFLSAAIRIAEKDLKTELRRAYEIVSILVFSAGSILLCSLAWSNTIANRPEVASAALWIILFFASVLTFTTSFTREMDRGTLGALKTLPCSPSAIFFGKALYAIALLSLITGVLLLFSGVFLNVTFFENLLETSLIFFLGVVNLAFAGSFVSGLVMFSEGKTLLLPFLLFPICMPALVPAVLATEKIVTGLSLISVIPEVRLLFAFLCLIIVLVSLAFKFIIQE